MIQQPPHRRPFICANWKMQLSIADSAALARQIRSASGAWDAGPEIALAPSFPALHAVSEALAGSGIALAAQNIAWLPRGALTGEVSAAQLDEIGCRFVLVGHSERRLLCGETDQIIHHKMRTAIEAGLFPILCIGERIEEKNQNLTLSVLQQQLAAAWGDLPSASGWRLVVAYEPVWAIGSGTPANPEEIQKIHTEIRKILFKCMGSVAHSVRIVYGGSVSAAQAALLRSCPDVDGVLVGSASLVAESFFGVVRSFEGVSWAS